MEPTKEQQLAERLTILERRFRLERARRRAGTSDLGTLVVTLAGVTALGALCWFVHSSPGSLPCPVPPSELDEEGRE